MRSWPRSPYRLEQTGANVSIALTKLGLTFVSLPGLVGTPFNAGAQPGSDPPAWFLAGSTLPLLFSQNLAYAIAGQNSKRVGLRVLPVPGGAPSGPALLARPSLPGLAPARKPDSSPAAKSLFVITQALALYYCIQAIRHAR